MITQTTAPPKKKLEQVRKEAETLAHLEPDGEVLTGYEPVRLGWSLMDKELEEEGRIKLRFALTRRGRWELINQLEGLCNFQYMPSWADLRREELRRFVLSPGSDPINLDAWLPPRYELSNFYRLAQEILEDFRTLYPECERLRG